MQICAPLTKSRCKVTGDRDTEEKRRKKWGHDKSVKHFEAGDVQDIKVSSTYIFIFCYCRPEIVYDRHTERPLQPVPSLKAALAPNLAGSEYPYRLLLWIWIERFVPFVIQWIVFGEPIANGTTNTRWHTNSFVQPPKLLPRYNISVCACVKTRPQVVSATPVQVICYLWDAMSEA